MFRPIIFLAIIRLDTIIGENYTIYNMVQYNHQYWYTNTDGCVVIYCVVFSDNCIQPEDDQK